MAEMHAFLEGRHEGEVTVTKEPKLHPSLSAAQPVTAAPSAAPSRLGTAPSTALPTNHWILKLHTLGFLILSKNTILTCRWDKNHSLACGNVNDAFSRVGTYRVRTARTQHHKQAGEESGNE